MKKVLLFAIVSVMFVFGGCTRTRTCNCVLTKTFVDFSDPDNNYESVENVLQDIYRGHCEDLNEEIRKDTYDQLYIQKLECTK